MADISNIAAVLSNIKAAVEIAKFIIESDQLIEKAEIKLKMADLISALSSAKIEMAQVRDQLSEKDAQIKLLQQDLEIKKVIEYERPYYWLHDAHHKDGPYCQVCYDANRQLIRLQNIGTGNWNCLLCKNNFRDSNYRPPSSSVAFGR